MNCKYCGGTSVTKFGTYKGAQRFWCNNCKRKFTPKNTLPKMQITIDVIQDTMLMRQIGMSLKMTSHEINQKYQLQIGGTTILHWEQNPKVNQWLQEGIIDDTYPQMSKM